jgi:hypothetical protein
LKDRHCINFSLVASVLADLKQENQKFWLANYHCCVFSFCIRESLLQPNLAHCFSLRRRIQDALIYRALLEQFFCELSFRDQAFMNSFASVSVVVRVDTISYSSDAALT